MYVVACTSTYNIDMAGIFVELKCDGSPVFLGLPVDPLEAPRGPPGVRGPQVETPDLDHIDIESVPNFKYSQVSSMVA